LGMTVVAVRAMPMPPQLRTVVGGSCSEAIADGGPTEGLQWVCMPGGTFQMGSDSGGSDELPVHEVTVPSFEILRTEVTVRQYGECVSARACTEPGTGTRGNWNDPGYEDHPVNYVTWQQAVDFCVWAGGRLPSEAEWEYAARSGGLDQEYPWGEERANCDYAVRHEGVAGCGADRTREVCSRPAGNTRQGLCDMAGNTHEWVQDWYHGNYRGAPTDGTAWEHPR
jgi:formylglycine-generating enzyme required for sulfatase activity